MRVRSMDMTITATHPGKSCFHVISGQGASSRDSAPYFTKFRLQMGVTQKGDGQVPTSSPMLVRKGSSPWLPSRWYSHRYVSSGPTVQSSTDCVCDISSHTVDGNLSHLPRRMSPLCEQVRLTIPREWLKLYKAKYGLRGLSPA